MAIIAKVAEYSVKGLPVADSVSLPKLSALVFYTDAAGASFTFVGGKDFTTTTRGRVCPALQDLRKTMFGPRQGCHGRTSC